MMINALSRDDMTAAFKRSGRRMTPQRRAIIGHLAGRTDHPSARQIYAHLSPRLSSLSLATVYNTLATLVGQGLIREVDFEAADNRYDTNLAPHLNLVCIHCGTITDVHHELPLPRETIRVELGFEVVDSRFEYRGFCAACRAHGSG
jgi:Fur family peroxide stress response transcriptional regulator